VRKIWQQKWRDLRTDAQARLRSLFEITPAEQKIILLVVAIFVAGVIIRLLRALNTK